LSSVKGQTTQLPNYSCSENNATIQFTLSSSSHSASNSTSSCSLQQCNTSLNNNDNCRSSSTPCFDYRTINNISYCAPGILCSILERCDNITQTCSSNNSICVINSCCSSQAVCLPFLATRMCKTGWFSTGNMSAARYGHTASVLLNGLVLVTGGFDFSNYLNSVELYDPSTGTWTTTGSITEARSVHTASLLSNGKVLVTGGYNGSFLNSAELYDPLTSIWTTTGNMMNARYSHTASLLSNGLVLVISGEGAGNIVLNSAELYDSSTGTWTITGNITNARWGHTASVLSNGLVLVAGGYNGSIVYNSAELYDPSTGTWTSTSSMINARYDHTASVLSNGKVLVTGGVDNGYISLNSAELYDPSASTWTTTSNMTNPRQAHTASVLSNGKVLVTGGYGISSALNSAELISVWAQNQLGLRASGNLRGLQIGAAVVVDQIRRNIDFKQYNEKIQRDCTGATANTIGWAQQNLMKVRGHTLVWPDDRRIPKWLLDQESSITSDKAKLLLSNYIHSVVGRYRGKILWWDVINEAINDTNTTNPLNLRDRFWMRKLGPDFLNFAFQFAQAADPNVKLYYNDYGIESIGLKATRTLNLVNWLRSQGATVHGIGLQWHIDFSRSIVRNDGHYQSAQQFINNQLDISVTELDVTIPTNGGYLIDRADLYKQAIVYRAMLEYAIYFYPKCEALLTWGFTDRYSWLPEYYKNNRGAGLPLDWIYLAKPAFLEMQELITRVVVDGVYRLSPQLQSDKCLGASQIGINSIIQLYNDECNKTNQKWNIT
ncbi:unnamed protein product, partial [Adineta steineri]